MSLSYKDIWVWDYVRTKPRLSYFFITINMLIVIFNTLHEIIIMMIGEGFYTVFMAALIIMGVDTSLKWLIGLFKYIKSHKGVAV